MGKNMLCAALAVAFLGMGLSVAPSAMQRPDRPAIDRAVQPVVCVGDRRNYRDFNQCWQVNSRRVPSRRYIANYCSRICGTGYDK